MVSKSPKIIKDQTGIAGTEVVWNYLVCTKQFQMVVQKTLIVIQHSGSHC